MTKKTLRSTHRTRQGAILFLLLLGPAPISLVLVLFGNSPSAVTAVLVATAALVGLLLELYRRQRRDAAKADLPVLPFGQVLVMLAMVGGIGIGTFLLPHGDLAPVGLGSVTLVLILAYTMAAWIGPGLKDPDERSLVLVLALMASLIALANACV